MRYLRLLSALALLSVASGAGAQIYSVASFDCWIGNAGGVYTTHFLRCIGDLDVSSTAMDEADEMLRRIHALLHQSAIGEVEQIVQGNPDLHRNGRVRSIVLYSYPSDWSWEEGRPQRLASNAWCSTPESCQLTFFRR